MVKRYGILAVVSFDGLKILPRKIQVLPYCASVLVYASLHIQEVMILPPESWEGGTL
jgi:hypothetical protein